MRRLRAEERSTTACGGAVDDGGDNGNEEIPYGSVVEVQMYHPGGYGREWLDKLGEAFAETYKDEGYSINIVKAEKDLNVNNEILTPKKPRPICILRAIAE